ncbi:MAG: YceI family protein [Sterolibacterium sp.]|nr:YceI family protein [Sterolibacterium sp.]
MKKSLAALALSAILSAPALAADSYTIDPGHTYPSFEINHLGFSTQRGRFDKNSGKITLDATAKTGSVELNIDVASINMVVPALTKHLLSEDFFNAEKFKTMSFKSDKLVFEGDKIVAAEGNFTLLGVTKPLRLTVSNFHCGQNPMSKKTMCGADVTATIKRSEFGMTKYLPAIGDEVKIGAPVEAYKD